MSPLSTGPSRRSPDCVRAETSTERPDGRHFHETTGAPGGPWIDQQQGSRQNTQAMGGISLVGELRCRRHLRLTHRCCRGGRSAPRGQAERRDCRHSQYWAMDEAPYSVRTISSRAAELMQGSVAIVRAVAERFSNKRVWPERSRLAANLTRRVNPPRTDRATAPGCSSASPSASPDADPAVPRQASTTRGPSPEPSPPRHMG